MCKLMKTVDDENIVPCYISGEMFLLEKLVEEFSDCFVWLHTIGCTTFRYSDMTLEYFSRVFKNEQLTY